MTTLDPTGTTTSPTPAGPGTPAGTARRAGSREWIALAVLMLPVLLTSVDNTVLSFALPQVTSALRPSGQQLLWLVDLYPLMLAGFLVPMGALGDRIGRRRLLLIGALGFGLTSVMAAYSQSATMLLTSRALLGVFGATLMPSTLSLIRNIFDDRRDRRLAIAAWAAMFSGGAALGPIVGGWLLERAWWGSVFLINVPIIVAFLALAVLLVPESRDPDPGRLDVLSISLSLTAMLPLVYAIKQGAVHGLTDQVLAAVAVGVVSAVLFVRRQRHLRRPMVDLTLFGDRVFSGAIVANLLSLMGFAGFLFFAAQFLQLVAGLSPMDAAMALLPGLVVTIVAGFLAVRLVALASVRTVVAGSFVLTASGYAVAAFSGTPTVASFIVAFAVMGAGIGMAETLTNDVMLTSVSPRQAGAASAISETAYEIGAVLGTAVLGSVLNLTYRHDLLIPGRVGVGDTSRYETLGGTLDAVASYPATVGWQLRDSAVAAFESGMEHTSAAAIVVALAGALVAWVTLRDAER